MNYEEWEKIIKERRRTEGEKFSLRSHLAIGYDQVEDRFTEIQVYPDAFLQALKHTFPTAHIRDIEYKIVDDGNRSSETFYATVSVDGMEMVFRIWVNHLKQSITFHYAESRDENAKFKQTVFQLYSLCKLFLENHSPYRLFFSTQSYKLNVPDFFSDVANNTQRS